MNNRRWLNALIFTVLAFQSLPLCSSKLRGRLMKIVAHRLENEWKIIGDGYYHIADEWCDPNVYHNNQFIIRENKIVDSEGAMGGCFASDSPDHSKIAFFHFTRKNLWQDKDSYLLTLYDVKKEGYIYFKISLTPWFAEMEEFSNKDFWVDPLAVSNCGTKIAFLVKGTNKEKSIEDNSRSPLEYKAIYVYTMKSLNEGTGQRISLDKYGLKDDPNTYKSEGALDFDSKKPSIGFVYYRRQQSESNMPPEVFFKPFDLNPVEVSSSE